jgi:5-methylthioribose kinase
MAKTKGFKEWYLASIMADTAAYAGTELVRRTVGMAQVKDVTTIPDPDKRAYAERLNILCAKDYILNRAMYHTGGDFVFRGQTRRRGRKVKARARSERKCPKRTS